MKRHRVALAANLALVVAAGTVVVYAVSANGFEAHQAELNDGGIWVSNSKDGLHGRINKPIDQADAAFLTEPDHNLDIAQQGASVVGVDLTQHLITAIDPATVRPVEGSEAAVPSDAQVLMAGGTLAVLDRASGSVWAVSVDADGGSPQIATVAESSKPLAEVGKTAAMTVTARGDVVAVSSETDQMVTVRHSGMRYTAGQPRDIGTDIGESVQVTSVGEQIVLLDSETGDLRVIGGGEAALAPGGVLQQPGPSASSVLVGASEELLDIDLGTGEVTQVAGGASGRPAEPVRLGACVYGAWSGGRGAVVTACGQEAPTPQPLSAQATDVVFRVNRGEILLNDRASGTVWNVDDEQPVRIDDWDPFLSDTSNEKDKDQDNNDDQGDRQPPKAQPDDLGARPGRLTVLYPLDNDSAPPGRILAINAVSNVSGPGKVAIGPDGQTVQIDLPADANGPTTFTYAINDGRETGQAQANVTVATRSGQANDEPELRQGYEPRNWVVASGGLLDIPVLPDWRDRGDGDPVAVVGARAIGGDQSGATARVTASGRIRFSAPPQEGVTEVEYQVSDGRGRPVAETISIRVLPRRSTEAFAPTAEPDIVTGEVGEIISISPLGNDLPGADPVSPQASLELAGRVAEPGGARVRTNMASGTITVQAREARTYFLDYDAAYGTAPISGGRIRVDVIEKQNPPPPPIAMPDQVTLFGQASTNVDVLANDLDPSGGMLVVQRANPVSDNELDVAVIDGRWIRVSARQGELTSNPQVIRYTISNGFVSGVQGEITVSQREAVADDTPVTTVDRVTVRAGASIAVPALDNDFSPSGSQLSLVSDVAGESPGSLTVRGGNNPGTAYVAGRTVRYVAPSDMDEQADFNIRYVATNDAGLTAPGRIEVNVVPAKRRNQAPTPPLLEGRTVAGDVVTLRLPGVGVDPDGDAVTVLGLGSGPRLGRIIRYGANSLQYQAFPGQRGTDEFNYRVVDSFGQEAEGTIRVAVVPGEIPQPPLPVPDQVRVAAGSTVRVDAMANDLIADGDHATIELVDPPAGVTLSDELGPIMVDSGTAQAGDTIQFVYRLTNGVDSNQTTVNVAVVDDFNNPPVAFDAFGATRDSERVTVDVLRTAYDPDGAKSGLVVEEVYTAAGAPEAVVDGGRITVTRGEAPTVVPFRIADADGGVASASLFVPARGHNLPYPRPDAVVQLDPGAEERINLADYIVNPAGGPVALTVTDRVHVSPPEGLSAAAQGRRELSVAAGRNMAGPGAITVEVQPTTGADRASLRNWVTIPVQVGRTRPIINCPNSPIEVPVGEQVEVTVLSQCHVWTEDPADAGGLNFQAEWTRTVPGLDIADDGGASITVTAGAGAEQDRPAIMAITADGSEPAELRFVATGGSPPSLTPIAVTDLTAGESTTIDLAPYFQPGVQGGTANLLNVRSLQNPAVSAEIVGGTQVQVTANAQANGEAVFAVVMSDVPRAEATAERRVEGRMTVRILGRPATPAAPVPGNVQVSGEVPVSWPAPDNNGSPIDRYEVRADRGGISRTCASTTCEIGGLNNGTTYRFSVRAHNAAGWSDWSAWSRGATPDSVPNQVGAVQLVRPGDRVLKIGWAAPSGSAQVDYYLVRYDGRERRVDVPTATISGLNNNRAYRFTVLAVNEVGAGPPRTSAPFQSQGPIRPPTAPTIQDPPGSPETANLQITWPVVSPNGPGPVFYRVLHNGVVIGSCNNIQETRCTLGGIPYNGARHTFQVGVNVAGELPVYGPAREYLAVGRPDSWAAVSVDPTGQDGEARVTATVPNSRGTSATVAILVNNQVFKTIEAGSGQRISDVLALGQNGGTYGVQMRVCNEVDRCSTSNSQSVTPFGPLRASDLINVRSVADGPNIQWFVTFNSQGNPATVIVRNQNGREDRLSSNTPGAVELATAVHRIGYDTTESVSVTLVDNDTGRGPIVQDRVSERTAAPPAYSMSLARGGACNDAAGSANPCNAPAVCGDPAADCFKVTLSYTNLVGQDGVCTVTGPNGLTIETFPISAQADYGATSNYTTSNGGPAGPYHVDCGRLGFADANL